MHVQCATKTAAKVKVTAALSDRICAALSDRIWTARGDRLTVLGGIKSTRAAAKTRVGNKLNEFPFGLVLLELPFEIWN